MCVGHSSFLPSRKKFHVFVWDSAPDVNLLGETSVFLRLTRFEDGVKYMEFTEAVHRSMANGCAVSLPLQSLTM